MVIIKTPEQIEGIRRSCLVAAHCLEYIEPYVVAGITTGELDQRIEDLLKDFKAVPAPKGYKMGDRTYPKATCISLNDVICHGIPDETILKNGDILNIDVTTIFNGYYGDTSRMFAVGDISEDAAKLMKVCEHCLELGIQQVKPGAHIGNIGYVIQKEAESHGYSIFEDYCGHGVGVMFHEEPNIPHYSPRKGIGPIMQPGWVFTIEPMINQGGKHGVLQEDQWSIKTADGKLSAQYEHTILVTADGHEILT